MAFAINPRSYTTSVDSIKTNLGATLRRRVASLASLKETLIYSINQPPVGENQRQ